MTTWMAPVAVNLVTLALAVTRCALQDYGELTAFNAAAVRTRPSVVPTRENVSALPAGEESSATNVSTERMQLK